VIEEAQSGFASGERDPVGIIQLRMNNVTSRGQFDWSSSIRVPPCSKNIEAYHLRAGDVLFNNTNSTDLVGKTALFIGHEEPVVFSNHFTRLRTRTSELLPDFLSLWLQHQWQNRVFAEICNRWIGQSAVQRDKLLELHIPLPTISEQQRIAAILTEQMATVDRARAATEAQMLTCSNLPRSYFHRCFHGITPLSATSIRDTAPTGWRWEMLSNLAKLESGHTPSRYHPEWWGGTIPWLALPDIRALDGKVAYQTLENTNSDGIANSSARVLPAETVVLSRTASVGFVTMMGRPMATSQDFVNWVCGPQLDPRFLALLLRASRDCIRSLSSGAVHKTVYMPTVKAFQVCIPPLGEQQRIAATLSEQLATVEQLSITLSEQLNTINRLPATLLRHAFNGEL